MTSDRPYRAAMSDALARAELRAGAGTQFDAEVTRAFRRLLDETPGGLNAADQTVGRAAALGV